MKYCDQCANQLQVINKGSVWYCPSCKTHLYANPIPTIDAMLFDNKGRILLGVRKIAPDKGKLNLPGGFVDPGETFEEAIERELEEELNLKANDYSQLTYAGSRINTHTHEGKKRQLISVIMIGDISHRDFPANDEVDKFVWMLPSDLKPEELTNNGEYEHIQKAARLKKVN